MTPEKIKKKDVRIFCDSCLKRIPVNIDYMELHRPYFVKCDTCKKEAMILFDGYKLKGKGWEGELV